MPAADARVRAARRSAFLVKVHSQGGPLIIRPAGAEGDAPPLDADGRCSTPLPGMPRVRRLRLQHGLRCRSERAPDARARVSQVWGR
jgi:hypothetical protein